MAILPTIHTTESKIESRVIQQDDPRGYLGMSSLGGNCLRAMWYGFHWVSFGSITAKTQRIFDRGHSEEKVIVDDLKRIGVKVTKFIDGKEEELTGDLLERQEEFVGCAGHVKGHPDGRALGVIEAPKTPHLLEFKTMQEKYFKPLVKDGVQIAQPKYFCQAQRYMHASHDTPVPLKRALFIATNKNNQMRHYERLYYDKVFALDLVRKETEVVMSDQPLIKLFKINDQACFFCNHKDVCHSGGQPNMNCRTCDNCDLMDKGIWHCIYWGKDLSREQQLEGCKEYKIGWRL